MNAATTGDDDDTGASHRGGAFRDPAFADALDYEPARALYQVWCAAWHEGSLPGKRAVTPPHTPARALPNLFVHEEEGARFRCRLTGSELDCVFGSNRSGAYLDEMLSGEALASRVGLMRRSLDEQTAMLFAGHLFAPEREHVRTMRLLLPVRDESTGARVIVGLAWFPSGLPAADTSGRKTSTATLIAVERTHGHL